VARGGDCLRRTRVQRGWRGERFLSWLRDGSDLRGE
jgi:hypothetical protein